MAYQDHFSTRQTSQKEKIPRTDQIPNSEGGFVWGVDDWTRLHRFLTIGSEGGTYYINERELTIENAEAVQRCIKEDGVRVVRTVVEVSQSGRAPKNNPALFVLAMCAGLGDENVRTVALANLHLVARIGTHLFTFLNYVEAFRGWGRSLRNAVARWYTEKPLDKVVYQTIKYPDRVGWTHMDVLRKAHPQTTNKNMNAFFKWITKGKATKYLYKAAPMLKGYELAKSVEKDGEIVELIQKYELTREMIPNHFLKSPVVWEALLEKIPMTAMIRNLGIMGSVGLLTPGKMDIINKITDELGNQERLHKSRIHPLNVLAALSVYGSGQNMRGSMTWEPVGQVLDALDAAFYQAFKNIEPTNKNIMLGIDVSASMTWNTVIANLTSRDLAAVMAMVTANVEPNYSIRAFSHELVPLNISPGQRLDAVVKTMGSLSHGGTDCSLPIVYALKHRIEVDTFAVYTDNETWAGDIHPAQAMREYRSKINPNAKLVVIGMESNGFSIADPDDGGMLDIVGFDANTPRVIANFTAS